MAAKSVSQSPEQAANEINGEQNQTSVSAPSNAQRQEELRANSNEVIDSLYSNDHFVRPDDSTQVLVQGTDRFAGGEINWQTRWEGPNGFRQEERLPDPGQVINVPFNFSEVEEVEHGDRITFTVIAEVDGRIDRQEREFIICLLYTSPSPRDRG